VTGSQALAAAVARLRAAGVEDAPGDARGLLAHALGLDPGRLLLVLPEPMPDGAEQRFGAMVAARAARQPVAQITGRRLFWGLPFRVTPDTLDPRPETETLVAEALRRPFWRMLDLGTGTGAILLACLKGMPVAHGVGTDLSEAALQVARGNAAALGLTHRARFRRADWFSGISDRFDLIVSNPPYIAAGEMPGLAPEVRDWEPHMALTPGGDGLDAYRAIARGAPARLMAGGRLLLEVGPTQAFAVSALLAAQGMTDIAILSDMDGRNRVVTAVMPGDTDACGAA
jgi:release factor glutamine methyltransferase